MSTPAPFSRLQLAAALLEYDNDPDNPEAPCRSAKESAIFAHLRRNPAARPDGPSRKSDYLGVSVPSETASLRGRESAFDTRKSRASKISSLRNPFGPDNASDFEEDEEAEEAEGLEVDLASWGLDAFMPKEKSKSAKSKGKQGASTVGSPRSRFPSTGQDFSLAAPQRALVTSTSVSLNNYIGAFEQDEPEQVDRRRSFGSPLELASMEPSILPRRRAASQGSMTTLFNPALVPFPTARTRSRSHSLGPEDALPEPRYKIHNQIHPVASINSRFIPNEDGEEMPIHARHVSNDSVAMYNAVESNPFAIQHSSHTSRFDPKSAARPRSYSNASLGSRIMLENDNVSTMTGDPYARERRYSTLELLRPKVLVMPSPLQPTSSRGPVRKPDREVRDGFEVSADGPPLPPGARSSRRLSSTISGFEKGDIPVASNSFIPNPLMDLSLSQNTFRNTLVVGDQSVGSMLPRATKDGEQIEWDSSEQKALAESSLTLEEQGKILRPAGKLYGTSLIDDLENRKAQMRSKQRVFTGDQRPSMMARGQQFPSTLIDPTSLQFKPSTHHLSSSELQNTQQGLTRQLSLSMKPLLNFDDEDNKPLQPSPAANRMPATRSVFGVDTLWEREMAKLREIQAMEEKEDQERKKHEELNKQKKKGKRKNQNSKFIPSEPDVPRRTIESHVPAEPPILPIIERALQPGPHRPLDSDDSDESDEGVIPDFILDEAPSWHVGSSDEENLVPRRTTGTGLRHSTHNQKSSRSLPVAEDSEEDLPLVATIQRAQIRATMNIRGSPRDSDDENRPLSHILERSYSNSMPIKPSNMSPRSARETDDDDDQPLGLLAPRIVPNIANADHEDDIPLAFHPEQQRRTQYQMLTQQQQQQQMILQAQMQSNILMNASLMNSSFYPPSVMNPLAMMQMQVPVPAPSPPPMQDEAKFGLVDRWRRDVVIEGENE